MILVVGATGRLGGLITRLLLERGESVHALVRNPSECGWLTAAGATLEVGDLRDPASLSAACSGASAVITTANSLSSGGADIESVDRAGNRNLIDAAAERGVERFIFVSVLGAAPESPMPLLSAKGEAETRLRESGIPAVILQPDFFMEMLPMQVIGAPALAGEPVTLVGEGRRMHSLVSMTDVAEYAVAALDRDDAVGLALPVGGPEPLSWRDVVATFERELGREIAVNYVPIGAEVPGMAPLLVDLLSVLETYDSPLDMSGPSAQFGVKPTSLNDFVHAFVVGARNERQPSAG
jgi:NADH dehydrogenase